MTDEPTNFLYPFIDAQENDPKSLLADLTASAQAKAAESLALRPELPDAPARANLLMCYVIGRWHGYAKSGFRQLPLDLLGVAVEVGPLTLHHCR